MPRFTLELSLLELDVMWRSQSLGEMPLIIDIPSPGATHTERAALEAQAWTDLIERDLADDHGHPTRSVVHALEVIAHRRLSLHLRTFGPDAFRAILARRGPRTIVCLLDNTRCRIARVADTGLPHTLVSLLPDVPAGPGRSVSTPAAGFVRATQATTPAATLAALTNHGLNHNDARTLLDMTTGSIRTGQIAVELRTPNGHTTRSPHVLAFHDTPHGRYQTLRQPTPADYIIITPTTTTTLARAIETLIHTTQTIHATHKRT